MKILINICVFVVLMSCNSITYQDFKIETFTKVPYETDGGACYFSKDENELKKEKYIFKNDFSSVAFMQINGEYVEFKLLSYKDLKNKSVKAIYNSSLYSLIIIIDPINQETGLKTGKLIVKSKSTKKEKTITFFGECSD